MYLDLITYSLLKILEAEPENVMYENLVRLGHSYGKVIETRTMSEHSS